MLIQHILGAINILLIKKIATKDCSNQIVCIKYCRKCYIFNNFFPCNFYIDFPPPHKH